MELKYSCLLIASVSSALGACAHRDGYQPPFSPSAEVVRLEQRFLRDPVAAAAVLSNQNRYAPNVNLCSSKDKYESLLREVQIMNDKIGWTRWTMTYPNDFSAECHKVTIGYRITRPGRLDE